MKRTVILLGFLSLAIFFVCCDKKEETGLVGSEWKYETSETVLILEFTDEESCWLFSARNDDTYSANKCLCSWVLGYGVDIFIYDAADSSTIPMMAGNFSSKNRKLHLTGDCFDEPITFVRLK